jgi:hypothetical protein
VDEIERGGGVRALPTGPWPTFARGGARGIVHARGAPNRRNTRFEGTMFRVDVATLEAYFVFDPKREADLRRLDGANQQSGRAPSLKRYFHKGTLVANRACASK